MPTLSSLVESSVARTLILPIVLAVVLIAAIETTIAVSLRPTFLDKTTWLLHDPFGDEPLDRLIVLEKLKLLDDDADIISVGDSSGFFSIQPTIVNRYLPGLKYINLSTGGNHTFEGFRGIAEHALQRSKRIKYVVLNILPFRTTETNLIVSAALGRTLHNNLVGIRSYLTPPSAALSPYARFQLLANRRYDGHPWSSHKVYVEMLDTAQLTLGWVPEHDVRFDRINEVLPFYSDQRIWYYRYPPFEQSFLRAALKDFNQMVRSYGAELIVSFHPMPARTILPNDLHAIEQDRALEQFQQEHPEVVFLFPLVTPFGPEKWAQWNHISREYSHISSKRMGLALRKYLAAAPASYPKFRAQYDVTKPRSPVTWRALGPPDGDMLDAAMAYFMYAATADESYRARISRRVLDLLEKEPAFGFMMDDTRARIALIAESKSRLTYSTSTLRGTPIEVSGLSHCDPSANVEWVHVEGAMTFGYETRGRQLPAPIPWPATSHIFIPTVIEDGIRKFDGYCPEPSVTELQSIEP
jgi:hypothetical protein